jgi:hypothetical protein
MAPNPLLQGQMNRFKGTPFKKRSYDDSLTTQNKMKFSPSRKKNAIQIYFSAYSSCLFRR